MKHERAARQWLGKWKAVEVELRNLDAKTRGLVRKRKALLHLGPACVTGAEAVRVIELSTRIGEDRDRHAKLTEKRDRFMRSFAMLMRAELER